MAVRNRGSVARRGSAGGVVLILAALSACGGGQDEDDRTASAACEPASGKVTLDYWSWVPGMQKAVDLWNSQNPDVQVKLKSTPAGNVGTYQNLSNALKAAKAPDLSQIEYDSLASFRLKGGLKDIAQCAGIPDAAPKFADWTWSQVDFGAGGKDGVWAVPQDTGPMALYYRKDVFDKLGLAAPTTWEEYEAAARKIQAAKKGQYITHFSQTDPNWFTGLLWQNKAPMFEREGDRWKVTVDRPESRKVADYWQKLIDDKLVATDLQGFSPALYKAWNDGEVVTWISAAWGYSTIRDNAKSTSGKWAVAPMPQWEKGGQQAGNWGGSTTAVLTGSKYPAEAAKFALWLNTDAKALEILNREGGLYPAARTGADLPALKQPVDFYGKQKIFDVFAEASQNVDTDFTWGPTMTDTYRFLSDGTAKATGGGSTLAEVLKATASQSVESLRKQSLDVTD
ncbi:ABC transporter substrate-binding protein [Streptomyces candidus]|uniref:Multiple sugar transport system substrate-binding protein n=1 Tax=Streptomyces candidus TaxID=67283 RepID=A0A7X0LQ18_9ACTN|nr:sugar ABC transporter substrate-binding protein [Streptomyces candidus]MBB6436049.1 multiple sugar transport system substrate-binding protein [Streptomyces candidus]GHH43467.1 sugar ABC transporter substrate-binding protein [Streptomyces candidus]